jgi:hypothetical protein
MSPIYHQVSKLEVDRWMASEIIRGLFATQMRTGLLDLDSGLRMTAVALLSP